MKKSISNLGKVLNKTEQKSINGSFGFYENEYGFCRTRNSFFCGVPDHVCCNSMCVLPTHAACGSGY